MLAIEYEAKERISISLQQTEARQRGRACMIFCMHPII
jgi:hypothetical protein